MDTKTTPTDAGGWYKVSQEWQAAYELTNLVSQQQLTEIKDLRCEVEQLKNDLLCAQMQCQSSQQWLWMLRNENTSLYLLIHEMETTGRSAGIPEAPMTPPQCTEGGSEDNTSSGETE